MKLNFKLSVGLALGLLASGASAKDIYVSKTTGSNKNPGTKEEPLKLLWKAIGKMEAGDHVYVAEGVYNGQKKSGVMPRIAVDGWTIEGGWKADFSERNPFQYLSIITGHPKKRGSTAEVFYHSSTHKNMKPIVLDGFLIDRGTAMDYSGHGEGGTDKQEGYQDTSPWGYQAINKKRAGSDPAVELLGKGSFTVRNMILVNNSWWGISIKAGGADKVLIENNMILSYQGRGIEAMAGGGWGKPQFIIRNNTVAFGSAMEGRALSLDPRSSYSGSYLVENNVLAYGAQSGVMTKFGGDTLTLNNNLIIGFTKADYGNGGSPSANVEEFEDELEFDNEDNVHETPKFLSKISKAWVDRWSQWKGLTNDDYFTSDEMMEARKMAGLGAYELPFFPGKTYASYKELPSGRVNFNMSRYPHPMKKGQELMDWNKSILPALGADGERGIQPYK